jgi:hypothetical protein
MRGSGKLRRRHPVLPLTLTLSPQAGRGDREPHASSASTSLSSPPMRRAPPSPARARASPRSTTWAPAPTAPFLPATATCPRAFASRPSTKWAPPATARSPRATLPPLPVHGERAGACPRRRPRVRGSYKLVRGSHLLRATRASTPAPEPAPTASRSAAPTSPRSTRWAPTPSVACPCALPPLPVHGERAGACPRRRPRVRGSVELRCRRLVLPLTLSFPQAGRGNPVRGKSIATAARGRQAGRGSSAPRRDAAEPL